MFRKEMIVLIVVIGLLQTSGYPSSSEDTELPKKYPIPYEGDGFEGDMLYPDVPMGRGVAKNGSTVRWTDGVVPYEFSPGFAHSEESIIITTMFKMERLVSISNNLCIHFRPKTTSDIYYITFTNGQGCTSYVGQNRGLNFTRYVSLQHPGCVYEGTIMHELLHALGFQHEQSRPDRDNYVRINFTNVTPGTESNFVKLSNASVDTLNISYDYNSIMHYGVTAFTVNGFPTIEVLQPNATIGANTMSPIDIEEVRIFYNCSASTNPLPIVPNATLPNIYVVNTTVSSSLISSDRMYNRYLSSRVDHYYHIYSIIVPVTGYYAIMSESPNDLYGYIYRSSFNSSMGSNNLIAYDDNNGGNQQFKIIMHLEANQQYRLVVTTYLRNQTGPYTITVSGLNSVNLNRVYEDETTVVTTTTNSPTEKNRQTVIITVAAVVGSVVVIVLIILAIQLNKMFTKKKLVGKKPKL